MKYAVKVERIVREIQWVEVTAGSPEEAKDIAHQYATTEKNLWHETDRRTQVVETNEVPE